VTDPIPERRSVVIERTLAASPEKLWRALTQPHLIEEWLMKSDFRPVEGHRFTLTNEPRPDTTVTIEAEVLKVEDNKTLSYSWSAYGLDTVVTFTLTPTENGTHLRLEQSAFGPDQNAAFYGARAGWTQFLKALEETLKRME
jgi:uncharacterized protein YndB with AHSA1/START domain